MRALMGLVHRYELMDSIRVEGRSESLPVVLPGVWLPLEPGGQIDHGALTSQQAAR